MTSSTLSSAPPPNSLKSRVARHRLVYDPLQNFIAQGLHALAIEIIETPLIDKHS